MADPRMHATSVKRLVRASAGITVRSLHRPAAPTNPVASVWRLFDTVSQTRADTVTAPPPEPAAVEADRLSKTFRLPHQRFSTLKERALHPLERRDRKSTRLNSSHANISYAV